MDGQDARPALPYFAYGTLLGEAHMRSRYPSAENVGHAVYADHELAFHRYGDGGAGGCTIVAKPGARLIGVLYRLSDEDMATLLEVGGDARWYEARRIDVQTPDGSTVHAVTLRVDGDAGPWVPAEPYGRLVTDGAREAALPTDYIERLDRIVTDASA
jgi:gamma-glutamylcyclotransferase